MSPRVAPLHRDGERVWVASVTEGDVAAYGRAVEASRHRLEPWNPVDPHAVATAVRVQGRDHRSLLIHARHLEGDHDLVGKVNVTSIVRGRLVAGTLGYDAFDPYAGRGLFAEGLRLAVDLAFAPEPAGLGLHRLEANVQPGNTRSAAVLRRLGFSREGFSPGYLYLGDADGRERWRDHDRYAVLAGEWPAQPFLRRRPRPTVVVVNGLPGSGKTSLGSRLAVELGVPLYSKDAVKEAVADGLGTPVGEREVVTNGRLGAGAMQAVWALLAASPAGGVVESVFLSGRDEHHLRAGLASAGLDAGSVPEVWCDVEPALARARFEERASRGERHPVHGPQLGLDTTWASWESAAPLAVGPVLRVDTSRPLSADRLTRLALQLRAVAATSPA